MSIQIETIITDEKGNRITISTHYEKESLLASNLETIELLVVKAKHDLGKSMESEILLLNQEAHTKKKKKVAIN
jgi:hypothetical protein